ncbi:MAG TPA: hypothetical protein VLD58_03785 [Gemmatimonadales bacterium]|nr:hypothetical protein [Gemmatimonadales bacterium]
MTETEFYVGYFPKAGAALARFLRRRILFLVIALAVLAAALALLAPRLGRGMFEYGLMRDFDGRVIESPYPVLAVARPGSARPAWSYYVLVGPGKHGAGRSVVGLDGRSVHLSGTLIHRDGSTAIEVAGRPTARSGADQPLDPIEDLGDMVLTGEIVDSKCHLGVMTPGEGPTHRGCAVQCIRGGAPPLLVARDSAGRDWRFLLTDASGAAVGSRILELVAVPVRVKGHASRLGELLYLAVEPSTIERL